MKLKLRYVHTKSNRKNGTSTQTKKGKWVKKKFIMEEKRVKARKIQSGVKICQKVQQFGT